MHIPSTIRTAFGPAYVPIREHVRVTLATHELFLLIRALEVDAERIRAAGHDAAACRLDWRVADLREAAR